MRRTGIVCSIISLTFINLFITVDSNNRRGGWNNGGHVRGHQGHNWQHGGNNNGNNFNGRRHQFQHNPTQHNNNSWHNNNNFKLGHPTHGNNYPHQPQYLQSYNNYKGTGNDNFQSNSQSEPETTPSISFTHNPSDTNCPVPVMGDKSKFELRCILPNDDMDKDCDTVGKILPSGTTVILKCKQPYINEQGEIRIWVCEDGSWKGEFKSINCIQEGYTFNFKNQTTTTKPTSNSHPSKQNYHHNTDYKSQPQPWDQGGAIDERRKPDSKRPPTTQKPRENTIMDNLFPALIDEDRTSEATLPPSFPAWKEPNQPEFQHPWFAAFEKWRQPETTTTESTTTTSTTKRPTTITTTRRSTTSPPSTTRPTTRPYGWIFTTPSTVPTTTPKPTESVTPPDSEDWNTYSNQNGKDVKDNGTEKCPSLRKRTGVQLECLAKTLVSRDPDSFLVSQSDCKSPQIVGTEATYKCQQYYESSAGLTIQYRKCKEDGTWTGGDNGFACALECGKANPVGRIPLITNGEPTYKAQWPWHAALFFRNEKEISPQYEYNCGATLINRRAVLTAAHCVTEFFSTQLKSVTAFRIDLGRYERTVEDEFVQTFSADYIIIHPSYNPHSFDSDLAIIILSGEATVGFHVRPICYPQTQNSAFEALHLADGSIGTVVGFGKNEQNELSNILHMARLKVVSQQECAESFTDTNYGTTLTKSTTFCAGLKNGTNVCSGDSGGGIYFPLNTGGSSRWYLQGLVSVGIGSQDGTNRCDPKRFSVFTRISPYADWIVRILSEKEAI